MKAEEQAQADRCPPHAEHGCGPPSIHCCWPQLTTPHRYSTPCHTRKLENKTGRPLSLFQCIKNCSNSNTSVVTVTLCQERSHYFWHRQLYGVPSTVLTHHQLKASPESPPPPPETGTGEQYGAASTTPLPPPSLSYRPEMGKRTPDVHTYRLADKSDIQTKATFRQKRHSDQKRRQYECLRILHIHCNFKIFWTGTP